MNKKMLHEVLFYLRNHLQDEIYEGIIDQNCLSKQQIFDQKDSNR